MARPSTSVEAWLQAFQDAVASEDFESGRRMFARDVCAYGTRTALMSNLDSLVDHQWTPIWTGTRGFHFTDVDFEAWLGAGWVVAARWESSSLHGTRRAGRCTLVLAGDPPRCVHSHFSMEPLDEGRLH
jgi:hypothetical protein